MSYFSDVERDLVVSSRTVLADGVVALDLVAHNGRDLPEWTPGAHVDLILPAQDGAPRIERQYSLCGDPADRSTWRVAVLREDGGRGGSRRVHDAVTEGSRLRVRGPRNHFPYQPKRGAPVVFIAGGIGITALRGMAEAAEASGASWSLHYAGRSRATMAFADDLTSRYPDRVRLHPADEGGRLELAALLADPDAEVYVCGPSRLLDAIETAMGVRAADALHVERFEAKAFGDPVWPGPFEVELLSTGDVVTVSTEESILDAIESQAPGVMVLSSCRRGTCGTCEATVLEGDIEHRDSVLTPLEQAESAVMMVCVSRAACPRIVLDL